MSIGGSHDFTDNHEKKLILTPTPQVFRIFAA